jgi:hypothetical protein
VTRAGVCYDERVSSIGSAHEARGESFRASARDFLLDLALLVGGIALVFRGLVGFGAIIAVSGVVALGRDASVRVRRAIERRPVVAAYLGALSVDALVDLVLSYPGSSSGWLYAEGTVAILCGAVAIREWLRFRQGLG